MPYFRSNLYLSINLGSNLAQPLVCNASELRGPTWLNYMYSFAMPLLLQVVRVGSPLVQRESAKNASRPLGQQTEHIFSKAPPPPPMLKFLKGSSSPLLPSIHPSIAISQLDSLLSARRQTEYRSRVGDYAPCHPRPCPCLSVISAISVLSLTHFPRWENRLTLPLPPLPPFFRLGPIKVLKITDP